MVEVQGPLNTEEIFKNYKDKIYRLALSITRNEKDAEDILQNTILKIMKNLINFRSESHLSTWIYKIAYNESLMLLRKRKRQSRLSGDLARSARRIPSDLFINWSKLPDEQLLDNEFKKRIDSIVKHMPIRYRMPLLLNNVEQIPDKESAQILGLKVNSLKTRLHRARLMIKSEVSDYFKDRQEKEERENKRCGIWTEFVYDYIGGHLDKKREAAFNNHIEDCAGCKSFLNTYLKAIQITKALQCQDLPLELQNKIETFLFKKE